MKNQSEPAPTPEESLRLINHERAAVAGRVQGNLLMYYLPWGVTWLIGFGTFVLRDGLGDSGPYMSMPHWLPLTVFFTLMGAAVVATVVAGARETAKIGGESSQRGMMYGLSWLLTFAAIMPMLGRFGDLLPPDERGLLFAAVPAALTGALFVAGSAIWRSWAMFALGGWLLLINLLGVLFGPGWHALILSLAGGGGLIVAGVVARAPWARVRR